MVDRAERCLDQTVDGEAAGPAGWAAEGRRRAACAERGNWTFLESERGGRTATVLYSLTGTCRHHGIDPFAYLQDVLRRLPSHPADQPGELLPDVWFASHSSARRKTAA